MPDAHDPIPDNAISLVDAFDHVFMALTPNWEELVKGLSPIWVVHPEDSNEKQKEIERENVIARKSWLDYDQAQLRTNEWLRSRIGDKSIVAYVRDPHLGEVLQLPSEGWSDPGILSAGITQNFVSPDDPINPGPAEATDRNGRRLPVFFLRAKFDELLSALDLCSGIQQSGLPGRPTSKYLLLAKLNERIAANVSEPTLEAESAWLREWIGKMHPEAPLPGQSATKNAIRGTYNKAKKAT